MIPTTVPQLRFLLLLSSLVLLPWIGVSQVKISGEVIHAGEALDQVTIRIYENGQYLRAIAANNKGRYQANLPYGHHYKFVFSRPYMIKVAIMIDTKVPASVRVAENSYEVPFNMTMHYRYEGMDLSKCREAIGTVRYAGSGDESFQFFEDPLSLSAMKAANRQSKEMEAKGKKAIMDEEENDTSEKMAATLPESKKTAPASSTDTVAFRTRTFSDERKEELERKKAESQALDLEAERQETLKRATSISGSMERERQQKAASAEESRVTAQWETLYETKRQRANQIVANREVNEAETNRRVTADSIRHEQLAAASARVRVSDSYVAKPHLIKHEFAEGWWFDEEIITVLEGKDKVEYRFTRWNWGLGESMTYYRNDNEIESEEFEKIRSLLVP